MLVSVLVRNIRPAAMAVSSNKANRTNNNAMPRSPRFKLVDFIISSPLFSNSGPKKLRGIIPKSESKIVDLRRARHGDHRAHPRLVVGGRSNDVQAYPYGADVEHPRSSGCR